MEDLATREELTNVIAYLHVHDAHNMVSVCAQTAEKIDRLEAIVAELEHTEDGVPITSAFETLWYWTAHKVPRLRKTTLYDRGFNPARCHSTEAAALAAQRKED